MSDRVCPVHGPFLSMACVFCGTENNWRDERARQAGGPVMDDRTKDQDCTACDSTEHCSRPYGICKRAGQPSAEQHLTQDEARAIRGLQRIAKRWPKSLILFGDGTLTVRKPEPGKLYDARYIVATIDGIRADGGDGGLEYTNE